jgi:hypothetical protein
VIRGLADQIDTVLWATSGAPPESTESIEREEIEF